MANVASRSGFLISSMFMFMNTASLSEFQLVFSTSLPFLPITIPGLAEWITALALPAAPQYRPC